VVNLEDLRNEVAQFAVDRDWDQFHSVRNLVLAMMGEVGEVAEILQWTDDDKVAELLNDGTRSTPKTSREAQPRNTPNSTTKPVSAVAT